MDFRIGDKVTGIFDDGGQVDGIIINFDFQGSVDLVKIKDAQGQVFLFDEDHVTIE